MVTAMLPYTERHLEVTGCLSLLCVLCSFRLMSSARCVRIRRCLLLGVGTLSFLFTHLRCNRLVLCGPVRQRLERTLQTTYFTDYTLARMVIAAPLPGEAPGEASASKGPAHSGILAAALDSYRAGGGGAGSSGGSVDEVVGVVEAGEPEDVEPEDGGAAVAAPPLSATVAVGSKSKKKKRGDASHGGASGVGSDAGLVAASPSTSDSPGPTTGAKGKSAKGGAASAPAATAAEPTGKVGGEGKKSKGAAASDTARVVGGKSKVAASGVAGGEVDVVGAQAATASAAHGSRKKQRS